MQTTMLRLDESPRFAALMAAGILVAVTGSYGSRMFMGMGVTPRADLVGARETLLALGTKKVPKCTVMSATAGSG